MNHEPVNPPAIGVGLLGCGQLGLVAAALIVAELGDEARLIGVAVRDLSRKRLGVPVSTRFTRDLNVVVDDPRIDVVVDVTGDADAAYGPLARALRSGKAAITSNLDLLDRHGETLQFHARRGGARLHGSAAERPAGAQTTDQAAKLVVADIAAAIDALHERQVTV